MKKRSKVILIVTVVLIILLCIAVPIVFLVYNDYGVTIGRLLVSDAGNMVIDGKTVIIMSDQSDDKDIFDGLRTGDKILVVHDGVEESLPARTGAYHIFRLAKGDESDIPEDAISSFVVKDYAYEADAIRDNMDEHDFNAQYIRTNGGIPEVEFPIVRIIRSLDDLDTYIQENKGYFDFERKETVTSSSIVSFPAACDKYYVNPSFFRDNMLVFVVLEEGSSSTRHTVSDVGMLDEELYIFINSQVPEVGTCDMAQWHVMIELNNSIEIADETNITVYMDKEEITVMDTKTEEYETGDE